MRERHYSVHCTFVQSLNYTRILLVSKSAGLELLMKVASRAEREKELSPLEGDSSRQVSDEKLLRRRNILTNAILKFCTTINFLKITQCKFLSRSNVFSRSKSDVVIITIPAKPYYAT